MAAERYKTVIRLPHSLADEVLAYAGRRGISGNDAMCILLREALIEDSLKEKERELILAKS